MYKLVDATFYPETGLSFVEINTPKGNFYGTARLHPDDTKYVSNFTGCEYAEMRAVIDYMKNNLYEEKVKLKALTDFYKALCGMRRHNPESFESRRLRKEIDLQKKKINDLKNEITSIKNSINYKIQEKDKIHKRMSAMDKNK